MINIFLTSISTSLLVINIRDIDIFINGRQLKFDLTFSDLSRTRHFLQVAYCQQLEGTNIATKLS